MDRQIALTTWLKSDTPLAYTPSVLTSLIQSISHHDAIPMELTQVNTGQIAVTTFANVVYDVASNSTTRRMPPFIEDGNFRSVMLFAIEETKRAAAMAGHNDTNSINLIKRAIQYVCSKLKIAHVPWSSNVEPGHQPLRTIVHHTWLTFTSLSSTTPSLSHDMLSRPQSSQMLAFTAATDIVHKNPYAEWSYMDVSLQNFATILHKRCPPSELSMEKTKFDGNSGDILEAYSAIISSYDGSQPIHQLALFCGYILAGLAPDVFAPKKPGSKAVKDKSVLQRYIRTLNWERRQGRKGTNQPASYITYGIPFILSYLDRKSSIQTKLKNNSDFNKAWVTKHSMHAIFILIFSTLTICINRPQGINHAASLSSRPCSPYHCQDSEFSSMGVGFAGTE